MTNDSSDIFELLGQLSIDLRAEVMARELIEEGLYDLSNVLILPQGSFKRSYSNEVAALLQDWNSDSREFPFLKIQTTREGLLDMIPLGMVYQQVPSHSERTADVMVKEAEEHEAQVRDGRIFLSPFDAEFGRQRIRLEQQEHQSITIPFTCYEDLFFELFWSSLRLEMSHWQKELILQLTMNAHRIAGDLNAFGAYIQPILGHQVRLELCSESDNFSNNISSMGVLGEIKIGVDWIAAGPYQDLENLLLKIIVSEVPTSEMTDYVFHGKLGKKYQLLSFLCDLLLPVEASWELVVEPEEGSFVIGLPHETGILGYTTILN